MQNKSNKYYSKKQEKIVAKTLNGKVQPNSGATNFAKGDVINKYFLIECKTSIAEKESYSIKKKDLEKLRTERFGSGKMYEALVFNFGPNTENFYIVDERFIKEFLYCVNEEI